MSPVSCSELSDVCLLSAIERNLESEEQERVSADMRIRKSQVNRLHVDVSASCSLFLFTRSHFSSCKKLLMQTITPACRHNHACKKHNWSLNDERKKKSLVCTLYVHLMPHMATLLFARPSQGRLSCFCYAWFSYSAKWKTWCPGSLVFVRPPKTQQLAHKVFQWEGSWLWVKKLTLANNCRLICSTALCVILTRLYNNSPT